MIKEHKHTNGLGPCLTIPIAAKSIEAIEKYVGSISFKSSQNKWLYVNFSPLEGPNDLPVWKLPRAALIHQTLQCWVHVDYRGYRARYKNCFEKENLHGYVIDHLMNRRLAAIRGYNYIRLIHVERNVNSSSGRGSEDVIIKLREDIEFDSQIIGESPFNISYADPGELLKILNIKPGPLANLGDLYKIFY